MNTQLSLIETTKVGSTTSLPDASARGGQVERSASEKPKSWQHTFVGIFYYKFEKETGEKCKLGWGGLKKMLTTFADKNWTDEESGECEHPTIEAWQEEVDAFFLDDFAGTQRGFHFSYLLKQFGSFKKFKPQKRTAPTDDIITHVCTGCRREMSHKRSYWLHYKNKTGRCGECNTQFNVNDILNQFQQVNNIMQNFQK